jgi:Na+/H+ antiporter NhaC
MIAFANGTNEFLEETYMKKSNPIALLPIGVFLILYLGLGILFEYGLKIPMGFYNIPIVVAFLAAIFVACLQNRKKTFDEKLELMAQGISDKNIITMLLIFLTAGAFVGVVGRSSAESVAYFMLSLIPAKFSVAVLFVVACFVSIAMGTSVGTITLITPIAVAVSQASGFQLPLCIASVMGGAMFGDNLSFISDTTIAACNGQGCAMKDKFKENFGIALPAAFATLVLILILSWNTKLSGAVVHEYHLVKIIPYILVFIGGVIGVNVFVVLLIGIASGSAIMLVTGHTAATDLLSNMGSGVSGMFETCMVAILVAALCALIREYGGFEALLSLIRRVFKGRRGGQLGMGLLVGTMDIATANNTVAIVMANPIAKEMAQEYDITSRKAASLLDTFSCISQGVIPYGAQMLVAISAAHELGFEVSAFDIIPNLFYPGFLLISSLFFIFIIPQKNM